jgi:hypothetical protein
MAVAKDVIFVSKIQAQKLHTLLTTEHFLFAPESLLTPYCTMVIICTTTFKLQNMLSTQCMNVFCVVCTVSSDTFLNIVK